MKKTGLSTLLHLLSVVLLFALAGCGANAGKSATAVQNGSLTAKLVWGASKNTAKSVALVPAGVTKVRLTVSGAGVPVVRNEVAVVAGLAGQGQVDGIYPGSVSLVVQALNSAGAVLFEGTALNVAVTSGNTTDVGTIAMTVPTVKAADAPCIGCHETTIDNAGQNLVAEFKNSGHYTNLAFTDANGVGTGCAGCHGPSHNVADPSASGRCAECHVPTVTGAHHSSTYLNGSTTVCSNCHNPHNPFGPFMGGSCVACHAFPQDKTGYGNYVNDNNGVRAIVPEFSKRSHHITGGSPTDAQCAVCHLEGVAVNGVITINRKYHMADAKIHLRDVDHAGTEFAWDGTNHTTMDNFCFSCHDADGAADLTTLKSLIPAATARNPFSDTLTNGYDQVARTGVVDVKTAFTTSNASHHAVSGQRYKYRFSTAANAAIWAARTGNPMPAASEIAEGHVDLDGNPIVFDPAETMTGDFTFGSGTGEGEATLYEAGKFVATYVPLGAAQNVADNSTLHCGDCHTVGQWKPGASTSANGAATTAVIGAHGSNNEYLLRNSLGTDELHNSLTYVCFNCHVAGITPGATSGAAGFGQLHPVQNKNQIKGYATAHAVSAMHIQCLADSADNAGATDRLAKSWEGDKVKNYDYLPAPGAVATAPAGGSDAASGNITGIACTNCHNAGLRSSFGGIHGGDNTYVDGLGRTQKTYRFMPGMGNYRYAPPGGWDGRDLTDSTLVTQAASGVGAGKGMGGCYTNSALTGADPNTGYSACSHHGTSTANSTNPNSGNPFPQPGFRTSYGGGTTATPTAVEPTVREATAGNALVTRPLKY